MPNWDPVTDAFHPNDAFSTVHKTYHLVRLLWDTMRNGEAALSQGIGFEKLDLASLRGAFAAVRTAALDELDDRISDAEDTIAEMLSP